MKHTKKYICSSSSNDQQFEYMLLDRLRTDCNYFLKHPHEKHLWAGSIDGQIEKMKELYDTLKIKPEWLSMEDINRYEKDMKAAASDKEVTAAQSVRTYQVKSSKSIKEDRQRDILTIKSNIEDNLVLDNYMGTGRSNYQDYQVELFHDSDTYGGYPWWYVISKDSKILVKRCYDDSLSNTLYSIAQFIYNRESESIEASLNADKSLKESIDGWDERTGVILRIAKYLEENPDADPPEGYIDPQGREISSYIARYGDYATTPFSRIKTRDLQDYARDHSLISPSPDILSTDEFLRKFHHLKSKKSPRSYSKWEKLVDIFNGQGLSVFDDWGILIKDDVELGNRYERLTDEAQENISKLLLKESVNSNTVSMIKKQFPKATIKTSASTYQVNELIKEIHDTIYNVSSKYLKAEGWDMADIADYFVADVQEVEPGVIRAEIRGELEYEQLSELCSQLDKVIAVKFDRDAYFEPVEPGIAEAFIRTGVQAGSRVTASLNYVTPEMKQLKRAVSKIYVDNDEQFHELVDSLLSNEPINLVPETLALKRAIDNMVVDSEEEKRTLVYEVAKDLGVIEYSTKIKAYTDADSDDALWDVIDDPEFEFRGVQDVGYDNDDNIMVIFDHSIREDMIEPIAEELLTAFRQYGYPVHEWNTNGDNVFILSREGILSSTDTDFNEIEDGWGEDVEGILTPVFAKTEKLMHEVRNTVRGSYTDCENVEDLADFIRNLADEFESAANEMELL